LSEAFADLGRYLRYNQALDRAYRRLESCDTG
jgi:hypothetical protein